MPKKLIALIYVPFAIVATALTYSIYQYASVPSVNKPQEIKRIEQINSKLYSFEQIRLEDFLNQDKIDSLASIATSLRAEEDSLTSLPYFEQVQSQYAADSTQYATLVKNRETTLNIIGTGVLAGILTYGAFSIRRAFREIKRREGI